MNESTQSSAMEAVRLGLLKFPQPGETFKGREGNIKPFIVDARGAGTNLALRVLVVNEMKSRIRQLRVDCIGGIAKSGTVWGAWLAWDLNLPFVNVLLEGPRSSGLNREVEGDPNGRRIVLIDNWARTGTSIDKAIKTVHNAGGEACGVVVLTRQPDVSLQIPLHSVWELTELVNASKAQGFLPMDFEFKGY